MPAPAKASTASKPKRARRNNKRTQVSSSESSSSSESESDTSDVSSSDADDSNVRAKNVKPAAAPVTKSKSGKRAADAKSTGKSGYSGEDVQMIDAEVAKESDARSKPENEDFQQWYLRTVTQELGDDLAKLREAQDFKDSSIPVLIEALKQGALVFTEDEKRLVMRGK